MGPRGTSEREKGECDSRTAAESFLLTSRSRASQCSRPFENPTSCRLPAAVGVRTTWEAAVYSIFHLLPPLEGDLASLTVRDQYLNNLNNTRTVGVA